MKRVIEAEKEYRRFHGQKAIDKFFETFPNLADDWKETFEWMLETGKDFFCDNLFGDGTKNSEWRYALHFDEQDDFTYICIIERA
jgi:hypothetical protein